MQEAMISKAKALLADGTVTRVIGWKRGEFAYDITPAVFESAQELDEGFVYDDFTAANVSKYLIKESRKEGKILCFLKPCDTYSFNQLIKEHRIIRENVSIVGIPSDGKLDAERIKSKGITGILSAQCDGDTVKVETLYGTETLPLADAMLEKCLSCKSKKHVTFDELIGEDGDLLESGRFDEVAKLEAMSEEERFDFWRDQFSRCIRCNACRDACPACTCEKCVFDNNNLYTSQKVAANSFEENLYHIIRAWHVAGRCTDCGECSRVCPQHIPLHLINRKFAKDINEIYGPYIAGSDMETKPPMLTYDTAKDAETSIVYERDNAAHGGK